MRPLRAACLAVLFLSLASVLPAQFHDDFTASKVLPQWSWTDPGNDSSFKIGPVFGHLRMTVPPGNDHTTGHGPPLYAGPKLTVPVRGDFTITTQVTVSYPPVPAAKESGLMIWKDRSNNLQLKRTNAFNSQNVLFYGNVGNARTTFHGNVRVRANAVFLRIVRAGSRFTGFYGTDGRIWTRAGSVSWGVGDPVQVGLATSYWLWFGSGRTPATGDYAFFDVEKPGAKMVADRAGISAVAGGAIGLGLGLGAARAGQIYLVLGSLAGATPGIRLPGNAVLPLNPDPLFSLMLALPNTTGLFETTVGRLDAAGKATARVVLPAGAMSPVFGRALRFAAVLFPPAVLPMGTTNAAEVAVVR